jgi:hypothetical protein
MKRRQEEKEREKDTRGGRHEKKETKTREKMS